MAIGIIGNDKSGWIIRIPPEDTAAFKDLVQRGSNLDPDATPEIKRFADLITSGYVLQDYQLQARTSRQYTSR